MMTPGDSPSFSFFHTGFCFSEERSMFRPGFSKLWGSVNGQLPGGSTSGPYLTHSVSTPPLKAPYPRMQDFQQLRCQLSPVGQSDLLRPLSHWRNLPTGHGPKIPARKETGSQAPMTSGYFIEQIIKQYFAMSRWFAYRSSLMVLFPLLKTKNA